LAPGAADAAVPADFRTMVGYGDIATAILAVLALIMMRTKFSGKLAFTWLFVVVGTVDTVNAIIQSIRFSVFNYPLWINWLIVTAYVPALIVSSILIFVYLLKPKPTQA